MSKTILIVESDTQVSQQLRAELEAKGCTVQETTDGKGSIDLIRRTKPDLVVLAVELSANQSGYLLCGKLKKDDDLRSVPLVLIGNPDGFAKHRELKVRADEYVAKPVVTDDFLAKVGGLIGFPAGLEELVEEEALGSLDLADEGSADMALDTLGDASEEIAVETEEPARSEELDLDAAFEDIAQPQAEEELGHDVEITGEHPAIAIPAPEAFAPDAFGAEDDGSEDKTTIGFMPDLEIAGPGVAAPAAYARAAPLPSAADSAELTNLRARIAELEASLAASLERVSDAEGRAENLQQDLLNQSTELEAAKQTGGKSDKDFFALKEASNKKDKEILKLKTELNEKEAELLEVRDRETTLEQQASEAASEMAKRDAQIKTLQTRADQLTAERKKVDAQLQSAKEEARSATAKAGAMQTELEQAQEQLRAQAAELESLNDRVQSLTATQAELESARASLSGELASARGETEAQNNALSEARGELETRGSELASTQSELETARGELDGVRAELETARGELTQQASQFSEEAEGLRARITTLEDEAARSEERLTKLYSRIKGDEQLKERTKKALAIAQQLLEEQPGDVQLDVEEAA